MVIVTTEAGEATFNMIAMIAATGTGAGIAATTTIAEGAIGLPEQRRDEQSEEPHSGPQDFAAAALPRAVLEPERRGIGAAVPR